MLRILNRSYHQIYLELLFSLGFNIRNRRNPEIKPPRKKKKKIKAHPSKLLRTSKSQQRHLFFDTHALVAVTLSRSSNLRPTWEDSLFGDRGSSLLTSKSLLSDSCTQCFESNNGLLSDITCTCSCCGCASVGTGTAWLDGVSCGTTPFSAADPEFLSKLGEQVSILGGWSISTLIVDEMELFRAG